MNDRRFDSLSRALAGTSSRRQALKLLGGGLAGGALVATGGAAVAQRGRGRGRGRPDSPSGSPVEDIPVTGVDGSGEQVFAGTLDIKRFVAADDQLFALGQLTGTVTKKGKEKKVRRGVRLPVESINGVALAGAGEAGAAAGRVGAQQVECDILNLVLGPLDLNLLGLRVQLNQVELDITAVPGGGLLGDLLCAVANLLNPLGALAEIAEALNNILDALDDIFG